MRYSYRFLPLSIALFAIWFTQSLYANESVKSVFRHMKYADAWHSSRKTGRPMLLFVTAQNCHFCRKMEQESYGKPQIMTTIERNFEAVAIDNSVSPDLVRKLRVRVFPTTFIVAPDGKIVGRIEGFIGPEQLTTYLEPAARTAQAGPSHPASTDGEEKK